MTYLTVNGDMIIIYHGITIRTYQVENLCQRTEKRELKVVDSEKGEVIIPNILRFENGRSP